jgi:hypothetical protein
MFDSLRGLSNCVRLVCVFACIQGILFSQNITGTLTGVVVDQSGGNVAGAKVVATNTGTGINYNAITTEAGVYVLPSLPPGPYEVTVENAGFKKSVRSDLSLGADQRLRIDFTLELGAVSEKVVIRVEAPLVQTEQANLGLTFEGANITKLPVGRSPFGVLPLVPGVGNSVYGAASGNINGSRDSMTDYQVDGTNAMLTTQGSNIITPILEMIEEFVVQPINYSAEAARGSAQMNVTTRAGTNELHGSLFYYFANNVLNANNFFNNLYGATRPVLRSNLFGGVAGGPVILPKVYDGRNRTFFSFGYEGTRNRGFGQSIDTVPTVAMDAGNFSGLATIYDPSTTAPSPSGGFLRTAFPQNQIPSSRIDSVAKNILAVAYPQPNQPGAANNFAYAGATSKTVDQYNVRIDHNISDKNRFTARYAYSGNEGINLVPLPGPAGAGSNSNFASGYTHVHHVTAEHVYLFSPSILNTFRFGYLVEPLGNGEPGTGAGWAAKLGIQNASPEFFPLASISGLTSFGGANVAAGHEAGNIQFSDSLQIVKGRHTVKVGFEFDRLGILWWQPANTSGSFSFDTQPTQNLSTRTQGFGFASFLLGIPSSSSISYYIPPTNPYDMWWNYAGAYLQDDFRVSKNLTLNMGVRWDLDYSRQEAQNRQSLFNLKTLQLDYAGVNGYPKTLFDANWRKFSPRFGFAYTPFNDSRTVIRGGYGIFVLPVNTIGGTPFAQGPWSSSQTYATLDSGVSFPLTLSTAFPVYNTSGPLVLNSATSVSWLARDYPVPYSQQWSFNIQRELPSHTLVEVGYVGTKGNHLQMNTNLNQVPPQLLGPGNAQSLRPYPNIGSIGASYNPIGNSIFHALQARMEKRFSHGFTANATYVFSKSIDDASGLFAYRTYDLTSPQNYYNLHLERSVSTFDVPHKLAWSFSEELPFGKSRHWLNRGGVTDAILGGWNLSVISTLSSGLPLVMSTVTNLTGSLTGSERPNRLRNGALSGAARSIYQWFDPSAFTLPPAFTYGNDSRTEPQMFGPGAFNLNFLLSKEFRIDEKRIVEFRGEFTNALNHFNPGMPNMTIGFAGAGTITSGNSGRSIVLALKLRF